MKYKNKRKIKKIFMFIKTISLFPHFWFTVFIITLVIITLLLSKHYSDMGNSFSSSIFANLFAGLVTGLVITIMAGIKNTYCAILHGRCAWLTETHKMILIFFENKHALYGYKKMTDEEFFNKAYDAGGSANHVNERIIQSTFDKVNWFDPSEYIKIKYKYNAIEKADDMESLHVFISNNGEDSIYRRDIIKKIELVSDSMFRLNSDILNDVRNMEVKLNVLAKSML